LGSSTRLRTTNVSILLLTQFQLPSLLNLTTFPK
jgi:hypothetical protein